MAAWRQGEPANIDEWLRAPDGRPRVTVVYTSHLDEDQRVFVTALLLNKIVSWVRRQPGTGDLRCLLYMDEIFGYFPPTANPPTKKPLLTLLKQARAHGLGVLLSTQNPVDLDYRGLANMGIWAIGRLQTTQDQARIRTGIEAALEDSEFAGSFDNLISGVQKRVFLVHDIHRPAPALVHSRWAMSYLRGPITRDEIERLPGATRTQPRAAATAAGTMAPGAATAAAAPRAGAASAPPPLPAPLRARYLNRFGGNIASPHLYVKAAVRYKAAGAAGPETVHSIAFPIDPSHGPAEVLTGAPIQVDEAALAEAPPAGVSYGDLPSFLAVEGAKTLERALRDRLDDAFTIDLLYDPETKSLSRPGEMMEDFALRLRDTPAIQSKRRSLESKLTSKRGQIQDRQEEVKARGMEKWASIGTSILSNASIIFGRKRTVTGVGGVLSKQRMESTARQRIERLQAEVVELEDEISRLSAVDPLRFETRSVKPSRSDVSLIRYDILWVT
jgi:cell division protein FtsB